MRLRPIAAALAVGSPAALAQAPAPAATIVAGERVNVCKARLAPCPVLSSQCDDPAIATVENGSAGAELKGVAPGSTLCALLGSSNVRIVVRVTVIPPPPPGKGGGPDARR
ncbi:MAG TPA: hypothetical protein VFK90_15745 [Anaeromyxobacter sp.]|nr:hypothetical protein [Anaeromyxobacter sp.]